MKSNWNINAYIKDLEENKIEDAFNVIGAQGVSWASENLRQNGSVITSNLLNSLSYATKKTQSTPKEHAPVEKPNYLALRVGTNVVYAPRVEFGFVGKDSLGRNYNQKAKPYLRPILNNAKTILKVIQKAISG